MKFRLLLHIYEKGKFVGQTIQEFECKDWTGLADIIRNINISDKTRDANSNANLIIAEILRPRISDIASEEDMSVRVMQILPVAN